MWLQRWWDQQEKPPTPVFSARTAPPQDYKMWAQPQHRCRLAFPAHMTGVLVSSRLKLRCIDKAKPPPPPPPAMSRTFVPRGVDTAGWSTFHNCHQLPIIQLLFRGTNVLLRLLLSQQWEGNKRWLINCVFTPRGWIYRLFCFCHQP